MHPIRDLITPVLWIFICLIHMLRCINDREIREKCIKIKYSGIVYWKDIIDYKWTKDEELEITFQLAACYTVNWSVFCS